MSKNTANTQIQSHFARAVHADIQRSVIMRNHTHKTTFNAGDLVPIYIDEVLPGDTFEMDMAFVSRLQTLLVPVMDNLTLDFYAFFVPNRLVWDGWEALNGENKNSAWTPTTPPPTVPMWTSNNDTVTAGSIGDYYGIPLNVQPSAMGGFSRLPFRGYALIWNEWFRDQNTQAPLVIITGQTEGVTRRYSPNQPLIKVNKKHDYYTSCLPAPQKGESALIPIELNELIPVVTGALLPDQSTIGGAGKALPGMLWRGNLAGNIVGASGVVTSHNTGGTDQTDVGQARAGGTPPTGSTNAVYPANLWADGRGMALNATTISELRTAFQIQKLYERDARGGTRYVEMLKAHFGVDAQDYRLQRPEFLGHMQSYVGVQQVPQTSSGTNDSPQANMAAYSHTTGKKTLFKKSFVEHGYVHIFVVARHPKTYQQGLERFWSRKDRLDFYMPVLGHISEQPVYNKEIFASNYAEENEGIFGYNEAWADYRYKPNRVSGQFRNNAPLSLKEWHYADWYDTRPFLSAGWMEDNSMVNVDRSLAMSSNDTGHNQIIMDIAFKCKATRPMPVHSIPGFVDHF